MTDNTREATEALEQARAERDKLPQGEGRQAMNRALDRVEVAISKAAEAVRVALEEAARVCEQWDATHPHRIAAAIRALKPGVAAQEPDDAAEDLYYRLHSLSKSLEGSGRLDEHDNPDAYATVLDAMNFVRRGTVAT